MFRRDWSRVFGELQLTNMCKHPIGLGGVRWKQRQSLAPFHEGLNVVTIFLQASCARRDDGEFLGIDERVTLRADQIARVKFEPTGFALPEIEIQRW